MEPKIPTLWFMMFWVAAALFVGGLLGWGLGVDQGIAKGEEVAKEKRQNLIDEMIEIGVCDMPFMREEHNNEARDAGL